MVLKYVVDGLDRYFNDNFTVMLIKWIYDHWSITTGDLAKPANMEGQDNKIEFRTGIKSDLKELQVLTLQGQTRVGQPDGSTGYIGTGTNDASFLTQVLVTTKADSGSMYDTSEHLRLMEKEIIEICGLYLQTPKTPNTDMFGIKNIVYDTGDRQYEPNDDFDKSEWDSIHSIWLWYVLVQRDL